MEQPVYGDYARTEVIPFVPEDTTILLDVGCGGGAFGAALKCARPGIVVRGLEPDPDRARTAATRLDEVVCGMFPADAPEDLVDVVAFNDVLEHFVDPWAALRATSELLRPGGVVVASIPNVRSVDVLFDLLVRRDWRYGEEGVLDRTHLRFFTRSSAERLFIESGYSILRCEGISRDLSSRKVGRALKLLRIRTELRYLQYVIVAMPINQSAALA